jgi:hypothetical protein
MKKQQAVIDNSFKSLNIQILILNMEDKGDTANIQGTAKKSAFSQIGAGNRVKQVRYTRLAEDDAAEDEK